MSATRSTREIEFLERNAQATVDVPTFEGSPRVNGPAAVDGARRQEQRIPSCLPDTREVLAVHEEANAPELLFREESENHVGLARRAIRILVQALCAGVVPLESDAADAVPFPHPNQARAV